MIRLPTSTWILLGTTAIAAAMAVLLAVTVPSPSERLASLSPEYSALPSLPAPSSKTYDFARLRDDALFYTARTYLAPPDPADAGPPRPDYQFVAALVLPKNASVAFLRHRGQPGTVKVKMNDVLDGWQVITIDTRRVVVARNDEQVEFASAASPPKPGLTRVTLSPTTAVATTGGNRTLGGQGSGRPMAGTPAHIETEARLYRPPQ